MKHRPAPLLWCGSRLARQIAVRLAPALLCTTVVACDDTRATLVILSDTTALPSSRVVVALPLDPATLPIVHNAPLPNGALGDSVRLAIARHDSASRADASFQRARAAANDAARALAPLDRTAEGYADRYAAWRVLADSAGRLRAERDRLRERLHRLNARLGPAAPDAAGRPRTRTLAAADSAAQAVGRDPKVTTLRGGSAKVSLAAGEWWITETTLEGALIVPARRVIMTSGRTDTLTVSAALPE